MSRAEVKFMLMNSFSTSEDTLEALAKYPSLGTGPWASLSAFKRELHLGLAAQRQRPGVRAEQGPKGHRGGERE